MIIDPRFWAGKRVCVTGGTGFLGWQLVQLLKPIARQLRVFGLRPASPGLQARLRDLECVFGDVRDPRAVAEAVGDVDVVFHTAATVGVWGRALIQMQDIHVGGTRQVLAALPARARLVHTSSVVAVGAARRPDTLTEDSAFRLRHLKVDYVHAKKAAEEVALAAAARGQDVVVVNPAYLLGPEDHEGSVMGRLCLRCWRGKMPLVPGGGFNFVDVRDVAAGHLLAAERGLSGRRYILGGENCTMMDFVRRLAQVRGRGARCCFPMPEWLYALIACGAELRARITQREPYPSRQHVRMNRHYWHYSCARARAELGFEPRPLLDTLHDMHEWFCATGALKRIGSGAGRPEAGTADRQAA